MALRILIATFFFCLAFGCARQHIYSSGNGQATPVRTEKPAAGTAEGTASPKTAADTGTSENTTSEATAPAFTESSITEEPVGQEASAKRETTEALKPEESVAAVSAVRDDSETASEPRTKEESHTDEAVAGGGLYFIQVGAFEDPGKARKVLATLMSDGYTGSRMIKDAGLYKVQAGGFTDEQSARDDLDRFRNQYPGSFLTR